MRNQRTLDALYHSVYGDPDFESYDGEGEEELYHHGVLGMSWGKRHGPPYPLDGVDKKIARAEAKRKREKERRMKKLQRAAKKARKLKKRQEKEQQDILKKKQKLVKKGDMDKIRKNADLFDNEELQYIMERDAMKRGLSGEKERTTDEKFDLAMKRMGQIADIAVKGGQVFGALKQGAEMVSAFHDVKVKELTKEGKHLENVGKEFDLRFKRDPEEAFNYLDREMGGKKYKSERDSKESKLEDKANRALRREQAEQQIQGIKDRAKQAKLDEKNAKLAEKQAKADAKQAKQDAKDAKKAEKQEAKYLENFKLDVKGGTATQTLSGKQLEYLKKSGIIRDMEVPMSAAKNQTKGMSFEGIDGSGTWGKTSASTAGNWFNMTRKEKRDASGWDPELFGLYGSTESINNPKSLSNWTTKSSGGSGWTRNDGTSSTKQNKQNDTPTFKGVDESSSWMRTSKPLSGSTKRFNIDENAFQKWVDSQSGSKKASSIDKASEPMKVAASWVRDGQKFDIPLWYTDAKGQVHNTFQNVPKKYWK